MVDTIKKLLKKISRKDRERISAIKESILNRKFENLDIKKLSGHKDLYRVRVGKYRLIFFDNGKDLYICAIRRRNDVTYDDV
ncbi:MAG: type II toxin-antitoxin system RelE/ParE family toxin [Patescibacteria group bacterium]